jgi:branched-chain amino acid transport system substrate-binding protein
MTWHRRLVLLAALLLPPAAGRAADLEIAFIGRLSGSSASIAQDQLDGFRLAVRHLGGRLGGVEFALTVIDDEGNAEMAMQAAQALWPAAQPRLLLVSSTAAVLDRLTPLAAAHRSLLLNLGQASAALAGRDCSPALFSLVMRDDSLQELSGAYLQGQGYHRVALFDSAANQAALEAFRRGFKGEVIEIRSRPGSINYARDLARLKEIKPDAAYFLHRGGMAVAFLLQFAAAGLKQQLPLFGPADMLDQTILAASAPAGLDLFSVGSWSEDLDAPANRRLSADFESDYGRPVSGRAAVGYDAAMLLDAALRAIDRRSLDPDQLRAAVRRVDFPSTRGSFRFDNDQFPVLTFWVRQVVSDPRGRLINEQRGLLQKDARDSLAHDCAMPAAPPLLPPARSH